MKKTKRKNVINMPCLVSIDEDIYNKIKEYIRISIRGRTIKQIMDKTKYARGTVKTYLTIMCYNKIILEEVYNQNTKVYFWLESVK